MQMRILSMMLAAGLTAMLAGCGGSSGSSGTTTLALYIGGEYERDGFASGDGIAEADGGGPATGDFDGNVNGQDFRQFFSFNVRVIPAGATVVSATLNLYYEGPVGDPFGKLGDVVVDHMDYDVLDPTDYTGAALTPAIATLMSDPGPVGYRSIDVTAALLADLAAQRIRSQYRLRFTQTSNADNVTDAAVFTDTENSATDTGGLPYLLVTYVP